MPFLDYKFRSILRDGRQTVVTVAFYAGEDALLTDALTGEAVMVYRRTAKIGERELMFRGDVSDEELRRVLNARLVAMVPQHPGRTPHPAQAATEPPTARPTSERTIA